MSRPPKFDLVAGTTSLYLDPTYYDYEYRDRVSDVWWYCDRYKELRMGNEPVLELGVGTGRIALRAVKAGVTVVGLDLSETMLRRAQERRAALAKARRTHLHLVRGDMRRFAFARRFPVVSCPFNAFQHLYTRDDVEACLGCVREHLMPGGVFLLDVLMPDLDYLNRPAFKTFSGIRFKHPLYGCHYTYAEQTAFDVVTQLNQMRFIYDSAEPNMPNESPWAPGHHSRPSGLGSTGAFPEQAAPASYSVQLSHRYFFPQELEALLHYNGFKVMCHYGDFELGELRADSESQVLVCGLR